VARLPNAAAHWRRHWGEAARVQSTSLRLAILTLNAAGLMQPSGCVLDLISKLGLKAGTASQRAVNPSVHPQACCCMAL